MSGALRYREPEDREKVEGRYSGSGGRNTPSLPVTPADTSAAADAVDAEVGLLLLRGASQKKWSSGVQNRSPLPLLLLSPLLLLANMKEMKRWQERQEGKGLVEVVGVGS